MVDDNQPNPGNEGAPIDSPIDGGLTQEEHVEVGSQQPVATDTWGNPDYRKKELDRIFRKGRNDGVKKGGEQAISNLLNDIGVESIEEIREWAINRETVEQAAVQTDEQHKQIRTLKIEAKNYQKQITDLQAIAEKYEHQAKHSARVDLKSRLLSLGAHSDGVDDAVEIALKNLRWSDDGRTLEVGTEDLEHLTVDEYLSELKQKKPWFFAASNKTGAGTETRVENTPSQPSSRVPGNWRDRVRYLQGNR